MDPVVFTIFLFMVLVISEINRSYRRRLRRAGEAWRRAASALGLEYSTAADLRPLRLAGKIDGHEVQVDHVPGILPTRGGALVTVRAPGIPAGLAMRAGKPGGRSGSAKNSPADQTMPPPAEPAPHAQFAAATDPGELDDETCARLAALAACGGSATWTAAGSHSSSPPPRLGP